MKAEFITPNDTKWTDFLGRIPHDVYHLPEYVLLAAEHEGGTPVAFYAETERGAMLAPMLIREMPNSLKAPGDWCDAVAPYGYPAPIMTDPADASSLEEFLKAFREIGAKRGLVTAFFRLHPLLPLPGEALTKYGTLVHHGQTVLIDIASSLEEIGKQVRYGHRTDIRNLARSGFSVKMDDWSYFQEFIHLYHMTMKRVEASEYYLFSESFFADLRSRLDRHLHLCVVLSPKREVAAAGLFTTTNGIVQYYLSGTSVEYLRQAPTKLMIEFVSHWAKEEGNHLFHLGGGFGGRSDSLFQFKAGFSKLKANFYTYRMILDIDRCATLDRLRKGRCGDKDEEPSDFFPPYRKPCK